MPSVRRARLVRIHPRASVSQRHPFKPAGQRHRCLDHAARRGDASRRRSGLSRASLEHPLLASTPTTTRGWRRRAFRRSHATARERWAPRSPGIGYPGRRTRRASRRGHRCSAHCRSAIVAIARNGGARSAREGPASAVRAEAGQKSASSQRIAPQSREKRLSIGLWGRPRTVASEIVRKSAGSMSGRARSSDRITENCGRQAQPSPAAIMAWIQSSCSEPKRTSRSTGNSPWPAS